MERNEEVLIKFTRKLNEFLKEGWGPYGYKLYRMEYLGCLSGRHFWSCGGNDRLTQTDLISKECMFIKRLVKHNKIDLLKLGKISYMGFGDKYTREETLLMLLAIQENPINFLISILK